MWYREAETKEMTFDERILRDAAERETRRHFELEGIDDPDAGLMRKKVEAVMTEVRRLYGSYSTLRRFAPGDDLTPLVKRAAEAIFMSKKSA